jgi:hypothetical protein
MKLIQKLTALAVCVTLILSLASCVDTGAGEGEDDFKMYFSGVYLLAANGSKKYVLEKHTIDKFNNDISMEDNDIPEVVSDKEYCYIAFKVSDGYTLSVSEFAFHVRTNEGDGVLDLSFYVADTLPTSSKNDDGAPDGSEGGEVGTESGGNDGDEGTEGGTDEDVYEDDWVSSLNNFHSSIFSVGEEWNSVLLQFDSTQVATSGQYVVIRVNNNCLINTDSDDDEEKLAPVSFTFNYLLFYFVDAHKN